MASNMNLYVNNMSAEGQTNGFEIEPAKEAGRYFRMGAAVAVAELVKSGQFTHNDPLRKWAKGYLASFGVHGMNDVFDLGIEGVYKYDFEALYL